MTRCVNDWNCNHAPMETWNVHLLVLHHGLATIIINSQCNSIGSVVISSILLCVHLWPADRQTDGADNEHIRLPTTKCRPNYIRMHLMLSASVPTAPQQIVCIWCIFKRIRCISIGATMWNTQEQRMWSFKFNSKSWGLAKTHIHVRIWYHSWEDGLQVLTMMLLRDLCLLNSECI